MHKEAQSISPLLERSQSRRHLLVAGVSLLLLLLAGALVSKPLYRLGKAWRARQLAGQAMVLLDGAHLEDAAAKMSAAFQLSPLEPAVLHAMSRFQSATGHPAEAVRFWESLKEIGALTPADRPDYAEDLFHAGYLAQALAENNALLAAHPADARSLRLAARIAATRGLFAQSVDFAQKAIAADPASAEGKLLLALLQLTARDPATRAAGLRDALTLGRDQGKIGLEALTVLAAMRDLPPASAGEVAPLLRAHPLASEEQRLMALSLDLQTRPAERAALLDHAFADYKNADPLKQRAFALWLNAHQEYQRTLALIPAAAALKRKDLLLVYLDTLASLKRWSDIQSILEGKNVPLDPVYLELFQARSAMELHQPMVASLHWTRAHEAAGPSPEQMWFLGKYAEEIGQMDQAGLAYESLKNNATTARAACEALLRLAQKKGDQEEMLKLLAEMHQRFPQDDSVANDYLYFSLLRGLNVVQCLREAEKLVEHSPSSLPHRTTLALAYLRVQNGPAALRVYDGLQIPWAEAGASHQAVYAAALGLAGQEAGARAQAKTIRLSALRPEEVELIKPWL